MLFVVNIRIKKIVKVNNMFLKNVHLKNKDLPNTRDSVKKVKSDV